VFLRAALLLGPPCLAALAYANALWNPFVYDDFALVVNNPSLRDPSNGVFVLVFQPFRPVVNASYALDRAVFGPGPFGFHLTSLLIHCANSALLALFFARLGRAHERAGEGASAAPGVAAFAAALFAVHPMATESVGYVAGRAEVLCAGFFLAALLCFQSAFAAAPGPRRALRIAGGLAAWAFALASKEVAAALPLILVLYDLVWLPRVDPARRGRLLRVYVPMLAAVAAGVALRFYAYRLAEEPTPGLGLATGVLTQFGVIWRYVGLFLVPLGQSLVHQVEEVRSLGEARALQGLAAGAALAGVAAVAWRLRRRAPYEAFGALWFLVLLAPSSLIPLPELAAEHRTYLAGAGLLLAVASLLARVPGALGLRPAAARTAAWLGAACLLAVLSALTVARNRVWSDPVALWADAARKAPWVFAPHLQLGDALRARGECEPALAAYRRALELVPGHLDARNHLGICLAETGRRDEARAAFLEVLARDPGHARARRNLETLSALEQAAPRP
jgi:tetratricopeptide (TPR) repeat protein